MRVLIFTISVFFSVVSQANDIILHVDKNLLIAKRAM